jgi:hypothetical protein
VRRVYLDVVVVVVVVLVVLVRLVTGVYMYVCRSDIRRLIYRQASPLTVA